MAIKKTSALDKYANVAAIDLTESAANTLTTAKFAFPFSIMDKMGILISRVEYELANLSSVLAASADQIIAGLVAGTAPDMTNPADPLVIDTYKTTRLDFGAAASGVVVQQPFIKDFSTLPGGGILVAPNPLYVAILGVSAGAAGRVKVRLFYTYFEMSTDEYWQLVESRRIISS